jgi:uncharacterized repeat protein (TIGR01451 family)
MPAPGTQPSGYYPQPPVSITVPVQRTVVPENTDPSGPPRDALYESGLGQTNENPTARQEPSISIEWIGPSAAKLGQPVTYQVIVKNIGVNSVQQVVVHVPVPTGAKINATEPKVPIEANQLVWSVGNLEPRDEKRLDLQLIPEATGTLVNRATVTLSAASATRLQVYQPKLILQSQAPEKAIVGDPATITLTVHNPGDASSEHVRLVANLSDGLEHAKGKAVEFDLGNLAPKESRSVQVLCGAKNEGAQKCEAVATAEPGLMARFTAAIEVLAPKLELAVTAPGMRYLDRRATVGLKVTNPGTAPATNITLVDQIPQGFKFLSASEDGRHDFVSRSVTWSLGDLAPGQSRDVSMELVAINTGEQKNKATVSAARGLKAEGEASTHIEGLPALLMELIDLDDPLEVGAETAYEIRVTNTGTKTESNLQLTCTVPDKMEFKGAKGPTGVPFKVDGKDVVFEPLSKLAPRADAIYRVNVKGLGAGDLRFRARIKADGLTDPVLKEESTKVYGDDVAPNTVTPPDVTPKPEHKDVTPADVTPKPEHTDKP